MQDAFSHCAELSADGATADRFLASLFAPADRRDALHALYAFNIEVARVRESGGASRFPARSACSGGATCSTANARRRRRPIRSRPRSPATVTRHRLVVSTLTALINLRFDLVKPMALSVTSKAHAPKSRSSVLLALAAQILAGMGAEIAASPAPAWRMPSPYCVPFLFTPGGASSRADRTPRSA